MANPTYASVEEAGWVAYCRHCDWTGPERDCWGDANEDGIEHDWLAHGHDPYGMFHDAGAAE